MPVNIEKEVPLSKYTSWGVGGPAEFLSLPASFEELRSALEWALENRTPCTIIGGGSNVLVSDSGIRGLVICLRKYSGLEVREEGGHLKMTALAGTGKNELLKVFLKRKLAPALFLAGLPGDVGGGVVMNAGVAESFQPREFCEIVEWVEVLRSKGNGLETQVLNAQDIHWEYRHSSGWQPGVISRVGLTWPLAEDAEVLAKVRQANKIRLTKQPLDKPSCGSVFRNPPGHKSAALIDSCGLKGYTVGGAQVSEKHANFVVNTGSASAKDIHDVIVYVRNKVSEQHGISLQTEVVYLGKHF